MSKLTTYQDPTALDTAGLEAEARKWIEAAKGFARARTGAQVMAGFYLRALREKYPTTGRPSTVISEKTRRSSASFSQKTTVAWSAYLAESLEITSETARIWIKMAGVVEKQAAATMADVAGVLRTLPWDWSPAEAEMVGDVTRKLCDGKTQQELIQAEFDFEREIGLARSEPGWKPGDCGNPKGAPTKAERTKKALAALDELPPELAALCADGCGFTVAERMEAQERWAVGYADLCRMLTVDGWAVRLPADEREAAAEGLRELADIMDGEAVPLRPKKAPRGLPFGAPDHPGRGINDQPKTPGDEPEATSEAWAL